MFLKKAFFVLFRIFLLISASLSFAQTPSLQQDPFVQQELNRSNWEVGGKYQPSDLRGSRVYNRGGDTTANITVLSSQQISNQLVQQNAYITAVYSYSVDLAANHPYTEHSPFDDAPISSSQTVSNGSKDTPVTLNIAWASVRNHRADAYDGVQGGGYPAPKGARDDYKFTISGTATGFYLVSTTEQQAKDRPPVTKHYVAGQEFFKKLGIDPSQKSIAQNANLIADKIKQYIAAHPKEALHKVLDGLGFVPALGAIPDLANAAFYSFEGDFQNAALSAVAAIPLYGDLTKAGSYVVKAEKSALKSEKALEAFNGLSPKNKATHELYKDELRANMGKPYVKNEKLSDIVDGLYRENASVGSGSTAAAVREELLTGKPVGGKWHSQKASDNITTLEKWLKNNPTASNGDKAAAENIIKDMKNALNGK